jgi:hypothetical protein
VTFALFCVNGGESLAVATVSAVFHFVERRRHHHARQRHAEQYVQLADPVPDQVGELQSASF